MSLGGNAHLLHGISMLFRSHTGSDCTIILCQEKEVTRLHAKRPRLDVDTVAEGATPEVFDRVPAHRVILRVASKCFAAWLERWFADVAGSPSAAGPCELRVPVSNAEEASAAKAAIQFAYTGQVAADSSIREILQLCRQGAYLQIDGCGDACGSSLETKLKAAEAPPSFPTVLELFKSADLWPEPDEVPSFAAVRDAAAAALASHFGDALKTLNTPSLLEQLLTLPPTALEALLASDDFGTDSESSVLQLLATWMDKNYSDVDAETRRRLCRSVRLVHLSRPYFIMILPALAADHEKDPGSQAGWFSGADVLQAAFLLNYAIATQEERSRVLAGASEMPQLKAVLQARPRRQCLCMGAESSYGWHLPQQQLREALEELKEGVTVDRFCTWDETNKTELNAGGFAWDLRIRLAAGKTAGGVFAYINLPNALRSLRSRLVRRDGLLALLEVNVGFTVRRRIAGVQADITKSLVNGPVHLDVTGRGWNNMLPLSKPLAAPDSSGASVDPMAAWAEYCLDGKMSGTLSFQPPR